ncbi:MAG: hypothetical protein EXR62_15160 [Chloroflexi bacterium]|nr:hypothetical protein [Chloroflexota bacterium]
MRGVPSFLGRETPHDMLATLQREKLVLDWRKRQQSRAAVQSTIRDMLDRLPPSYGKELYDKKVAQAYQHIYEGYYGAGRSLYTGVG